MPKYIFAGGAFTKIEDAASDTTPDAFDFSDKAGVALGALQTSDAVTVTGFDGTLSASASGGTIDVNGDGDFQASRNVVAGDQVRAQHTSSASYLTAVDTDVTIGGVTGRFTSTTLGDPANAAFIYRPFSFNWWNA